MRISASISDDNKENGLIKAFKRLGFRSSSPEPGQHGVPPPLPPKRPQHQTFPQGTNAASLPPYLAHLAGPTRPSSSAAQAQFPQPQRYDPGALTAISNSDGYSRPPLPRPPGQTTTSHVPTAHPTSLLSEPELILLGASPRIPYEWELVPQRKPLQDYNSEASSSALPDKHHGLDDAIVRSSTVHTAASSTSIAPATPPRKQQGKHVKLHSAQTLGLLTPNGSQKDVRCRPVKGQCWGITQEGMRCTRKVQSYSSSSVSSPVSAANKSGSTRRGSATPGDGASVANPLVVSESDSDDEVQVTAASNNGMDRRNNLIRRMDADETDEGYCWQHVKEVNKTTGFHPSLPQRNHTARSSIDKMARTPTDNFIDFSRWLDPSQLSKHAQALLRKRMSQPTSESDFNEPGYLYIYDLRDRSTNTHLCLKVGRATKVFRRIGQWRNRCQSKDPLLRAMYPSGENQGLLPGADHAESPGIPLSHRWEALVHLELADIGERIDELCRDCQTRHREIFLIPRIISKDGRHLDGFKLVQSTITKWMQFVQMLS